MDWVTRMNAAVDYIEEHIDGGEPIDEAALCRITACSFSLFQGSFTQISGVSLSEYIRRRKLTLATHDLQNTDAKVIDIALKYSYQSADAFTVAFKRMHGVSPMQARKPGAKLTFYCRATVESVTVHSEKDAAFTFRDGSEIHVDVRGK